MNEVVKSLRSWGRSPVLIIMVLLAMIPITFFSFSNVKEDQYAPKASRGRLDLKGWNFEEHGMVALEGEWEFYWNRLLTPEDFQNHLQGEDGLYMHVPGYWDAKRDSQNRVEGEGYSTYRLVIHSEEALKKIAIKVDAIFSAYRLWIGNEEVLSCGMVGDAPEGSKAGMEVLMGAYDLPGMGLKDIPITIQASNFIGGKGGILKNIYVGTAKQIQGMRETRLIKESALAAVTLFMGLFHLVLFGFRKKEQYVLYFGLLYILVSLRTLFLGELIIYSIFSGVDPEIFFKTSFVILCFSVMMFVMYYDRMFPYEISPLLKKMIIYMGISFAIVAYCFSYRVLYWLVYIFQGYALGVFSVLAVVTIRVIRKKLDGYILVAVAWSIIFISAVNDSLADLHIFQGWLSITNGIFIFLLLQTVLLCNKFANSFKAQELFYQVEIQALQAQIKPHFLFNVINTIAYFTKKDPTKAHSLLLDLANYLRNRYDFKNSSHLIELTDEIAHLKSYLNLEEARFSGRLKVIFDIPPGISIKIPPFLIQPLVENALKHGILPKEEGGMVAITVRKDRKGVTIRIQDDGVGIPEERLRGLLDNHIPGYGVGVRNVNQRLKHLYGKPLQVESKEGEGTVFIIEIPG